MARKLRGCFAGRLVEVTTRTFQSRYLLRPGRLINQTVTGVLARAQDRTGMKIVGPVAMSNHMHLLLAPETTKQLTEFMRYVNSNVARKVGRLHGWRGKFWDKRYSAIVVSHEEEAQVARLKYLLSQGVKEGLVKRPEDWPGLHVGRALEKGYSSISGGLWHDRTAQYRARLRVAANHVRTAEFVQKDLSIKLSTLPCWEGLTWRQRRDAVRALIDNIVLEAERQRDERTVVGAEAVSRQDPLAAPVKSERRNAPPCHAASRNARRKLLRELRDFRGAFLTAAEDLRNGRNACFPEGSFPPGLPYVAESTTPDG
ncbi:MAG: transposase [Acidobacteriota bacterium]